MKRQANPHLSASGELALAQYEQALREQEDLTPASFRNYLSDLRHFIAWYEACAAECATDTLVNSQFDLSAVTTPTLTRYRSYLLRYRFGYRMAKSVPLHRLVGHLAINLQKEGGCERLRRNSK